MEIVDTIAALEKFADLADNDICDNDDGTHLYRSCPFCLARHALNEIGAIADEALAAARRLMVAQ